MGAADRTRKREAVQVGLGGTDTYTHFEKEALAGIVAKHTQWAESQYGDGPEQKKGGTPILLYPPT